MASSTETTKTKLDSTISEDQLDLSIPLNLANSAAKDSPVLETIYKSAIKMYGEPRTAQLHQHSNGTCTLQNWFGRSKNKQDPLPPHVPPRCGPPIPFVIQNDDSKNKILRIGEGKHYFLANKAPRVIAVGDIYFSKDTKIDFFNDRSGAYCIPLDEFYIKRKMATFLAIMEVGLPIHKFRFFYPSDEAKTALYLALIKVGKDVNEALYLVLIACRVEESEARELISSGSVTSATFLGTTVLSNTHVVMAANSQSTVTATLKSTKENGDSAVTTNPAIQPLHILPNTVKAFTDTTTASSIGANNPLQPQLRFQYPKHKPNLKAQPTLPMPTSQSISDPLVFNRPPNSPIGKEAWKANTTTASIQAKNTSTHTSDPVAAVTPPSAASAALSSVASTSAQQPATTAVIIVPTTTTTQEDAQPLSSTSKNNGCSCLII